MVNLGPARGLKRAEMGLMIFLFKIPLLIVLWALGSNKGIIQRIYIVVTYVKCID